MERVIVDEAVHICVVCNQKVKDGNSVAMTIDGLWLCSLGCINKFLKEKRRWKLENWQELCKMQVSFQERKQAESNNNYK
ncbi:hypothetical protein ACFLW2_01475 [Chloroflexota bacterium]